MPDPVVPHGPPGPGDPAVSVEGLVVRYGHRTAVDDLSFEARPGEVFAILGPNGAGKTSTVETLEGYRVPTGGRVRVLGLDPRADHAALVARIGVMLQGGGLYPSLTPRQALWLFAHLYPDPLDPAALLRRLGLKAVARTPVRRLSGGERQRLSLALALVGRPEVLFLDEPTAGVDPEGRLVVRSLVAEERDRGCCVVLTTHELAEAEHLADRVLILVDGKAAAEGSLEELRGTVAQAAIAFAAPPGLPRADLDQLAGACGVPGGTVREVEPGRYEVGAEPTPARLAAVAAWLAERDLPVADLAAARRASLEAVYYEVAGRGRPSADLEEPAGDQPLGTPGNGPARGRRRAASGGRRR
ncbi:ABC transporter ATP-binding protein [Aciditerrimonas ferrireducens]|uniref:ABC transporter ATP-binding protein n=1 Tax=Aciditerrimonas ferrireducens TaxID=667306 RepID=UPI002004DFC7|nr:ABC transporter ATP-binding protein [Aciditerrimonas ferrireducens]MCK4177555.1 ABC transporter ATP-binding protein [Aciditerrimonas ferrireducens]